MEFRKNPLSAVRMPYSRTTILLLFVTGFSLAGLLMPGGAVASTGGGGSDLGKILPWWSAIPFVGILLSIALCPLLVPRFWHLHYGKTAVFWALLFALPFLYAFPHTAPREILHILLVDYIPFIILLWGLFTIAGGIVITGSFSGTPLVNTAMLLMGTLLASWVGTTGAAMVMLRPVLKANKTRQNKVHTVCFFIFLVANIGGALSPLGDPPLFLGFLHNVPFFWVTRAILPHMLFAVAVLLAMFYILDSCYFLREKQPEIIEELEKEKKVLLKIEGGYNFLFLAGVVGMVVSSGCRDGGFYSVRGIELEWQNLMRDAMIIVFGILSLVVTPKRLRHANDFTWFPIQEVAKLFAGIFVTIIPVLAILKAGEEGHFAPLLAVVKEPFHYFWISGILSSFLDNAPTYLTFFNMALGKLGLSESMVPAALAANSATANPAFIGFLKAISVGSVFMGANTYLGNAPNFMVNSIAKEFGVKMPGFFGYIFKYSLPILVPVFILVGFIFF
jgi:Na+/H+ antiporter NhaD/arsenite permease-like protein